MPGLDYISYKCNKSHTSSNITLFFKYEKPRETRKSKIKDSVDSRQEGDRRFSKGKGIGLRGENWSGL